MASEIIENYRAGAEVYNGHDLCKEKSIQLFVELGFSKGLLQFKDIMEFGYNREAGFIWLIQKNQTNHTFQQIGTVVTYAQEVTAFVERNKLKNINGVRTNFSDVKANKYLISFSIDEIHFEDPTPEMLTFKFDNELCASYLSSAFELKE